MLEQKIPQSAEIEVLKPVSKVVQDSTPAEAAKKEDAQPSSGSSLVEPSATGKMSAEQREQAAIAKK